MRLWRVAAALAAALLCALLALAGPGSVETVAARASGLPRWAQACMGQPADPDHPQLALCARVHGRVIYSDVSSGSGETHVLVVGDFHMVIVELAPGVRNPSWGSWITAVGPLVRARNGQREVEALWVHA